MLRMPRPVLVLVAKKKFAQMRRVRSTQVSSIQFWTGHVDFVRKVKSEGSPCVNRCKLVGHSNIKIPPAVDPVDRAPVIRQAVERGVREQGCTQKSVSRNHHQD